MVAGRKLLSPRALLVEESRASVAVTVAWMLMMLVCGLALLMASVLSGLTQWMSLSQEAKRGLALLSNLGLLIALITGPLCLVLTVVVFRVRRDRPPLAITVAAVILGVLPVILAMLLI